MKREAAALDDAEEVDVPDSAGAMHSLKRAEGEAGWDFDDEEHFSDDEQDKFEFDDQLETAATNADDMPVLAEEPEENEENPAAEDALGEHGRELQILLGQGLDEEGNPLQPADAEDDDE